MLFRRLHSNKLTTLDEGMMAKDAMTAENKNELTEQGELSETIVLDSIYNHPKYYDLLFGSDWRAEFDFLEDCFERYTDRLVQRLFEPACGTGRLLIRFAQAEYIVGGNDLNEKAIQYSNNRLERHGFGRPCVVGDMSDFGLESLPNKKPADAAFNTINTFRHLSDDKSAIAHLKCMSNVIADGGLYIIGIHLLPTEGIRMEQEAWSSRRGNLQVNSHMWSKEIVKRQEILGMRLDIYTPTSHQVVEDEMQYRTYTKAQFGKLLRQCREWEVAAIHDFAYDVDDEIEVTADTEDVVFVLRRR